MKQRSLRRAAEREAAKLARKQAITAPAELRSSQTQNPKQGEGHRVSQIPEFEQVPQKANRCTGPRTSAGKAISCLNNRKHGLTGSFCVLLSESGEVFDELRDALREEHAPVTPTELLLVDRLAEHVWLSQRAQRMQDDAAAKGEDSWFALMLRYQTTHDRGFHKCLAELRTLRRERIHKPEAQFESQNAVAAPEVLVQAAPEFESQTPKKYTKAELDRLSPAEISALVQTDLKKANINLSDFDHCDDEVRIAKLSEAA